MDISNTSAEVLDERADEIEPSDVDWDDLDKYGAEKLKVLDKTLKDKVSDEKDLALYEARQRARGRGGNQGIPEDQDWVWNAFGEKKDRCVATAKRTGNRCKRPAQKGLKVCRQHGGGTLAEPGQMGKGVEREMFKAKRDNELDQKVDELLESSEIEDARIEAAQARAVLDDIKERYVDEDISDKDMLDQIDKVSRIVKRFKEVEHKYALGQKDLEKLTSKLATWTKRHVPEEGGKRERALRDLRELIGDVL